MIIRDGLTFDDVLVVPKFSNVKSRKTDVDISVTLGKLRFEHPIIPANMKTVTGFDMAKAICSSGGLAILHRFMLENEQLYIADTMINEYHAQLKFGVSVGVKTNDKEMVDLFYNLGVRIVCIDIAHGHSEHCADMTDWIKSRYPEITVIAGNVATGIGALHLWDAGADIVKVGVGPGSLCTTRVETGNGVPQLSALIDVAEARDFEEQSLNRKLFFISDGGIKDTGDIVKALCLADMVMIGNLFAGCTETPGQVMSINGKTYKEYVGSSTHKSNNVEGVAAIVPTKGTYQDILNKMIEGLQSGCSYQGAHTLAQLKNDPEFIRITNAGLKESHAHDVILK